MYAYIKSPQYYSSAEIAWNVYDKYFVSNNAFLCVQEETKYIFQVFV